MISSLAAKQSCTSSPHLLIWRQPSYWSGGRIPPVFRGHLLVRIAFQVFKKNLDQRMYVYWFIKSPICSPKKNTSLFLEQGAKNSYISLNSLSFCDCCWLKSPCRIPYLLLELRCKFAHQALIHVTTSYSVRGFAKHTELATHEFYDAHGEDRVAHGAKPPVDGGAKMGEEVSSHIIGLSL